MSLRTLGALRILASQRPSRPPRSVASRDRVERTHHGRVPVTWIDRDRAARGVLVHVPGGAFVRGATRAHWAWLEEIGRRAGIATAVLHPRMAPRHPFPAPLEDVLAALDALEVDLGLLPDRWVLSGDGSGAGLALAAARARADVGVPAPAALLLSDPWVDLAHTAHLSRADRIGVRLHTQEVPREDPRLSPVLGDLTDLPPLHVTHGELAGSAAAAAALAARVRAADGEITVLTVPGAGDGTPVRRSDRGAQRARRDQIRTVRTAIGLEDEIDVGH